MAEQESYFTNKVQRGSTPAELIIYKGESTGSLKKDSRLDTIILECFLQIRMLKKALEPRIVVNAPSDGGDGIYGDEYGDEYE